MNVSTSRFRYTGQILLPGTELYHYKARVYHPKLGRFLQTDPTGYQDGMNWYAYVGNDPLSKNDPSGKVAMLLWLATPQGIAATNYVAGALIGLMGAVAVHEVIIEPLRNESAEDEPPPEIKKNKQNEHIKGSKAYKNRIKQLKPGQEAPSTWDNPEDADDLTQEAWEKGETVEGQPNTKIYEAGSKVGTQADGSVIME